ncbi:MAG: hypothetical protein ACF8GE_03115 [Phycisphaerales bacterium JB043]
MSDTHHIVMVGHCVPDQFLLKRAVKKAVPGAEISKVNSSSALDEALSSASLLLINRVLDGRFGDDDSQSMIERLSSRVACVLISNYEDAQQEAERAGAHPGFGKSKLGAEETHERIRGALGIASA